MKIIITISKVQQSDLELMKAALNNYASTLQMLQEVMPQPKSFMKDLSITVEIWYDFNIKTAARNPAAHSQLKLSIHKALILMDALNELISQSSTNHYERSRCSRFVFAIDEQLPTNTQLATKLKP